MKRSMIKKETYQQQQTKTNMNTSVIQVEWEGREYNIGKCRFILSIQYSSQGLKK